MSYERGIRLVVSVVALALCASGCGQPRLALDPIPIQDDDRYDIPEPKERERDDYYDVLDYTLYKQVQQMFDMPRNFRKLGGKPKQALNVTPLDEIQDSTWFTNRIGVRDFTGEQVLQGPNEPQGPDVTQTWTIVRAKTQGVTPGFTIEDSRGDRYVIKFDPQDDPELATGAEAISTRLFWAIGYNTPQNYVVYFDPSILEIGSGARVGRRKRQMTQEDLGAILERVPRAPDGSLRAIASRYISGKPVGPPSWEGRRKDDPNDVIPHEHRRELRAYRVFCAWLHHNDSRVINAADFYVEEEGRHFVRHYLIDFGATLGSRSYSVNMRSEGYEYLFDFGEMSKSLLSVGIYERPWLGIQYPEIPGFGRFEADHFDPGSWKPDYPNPAFQNLTPQDGFWGAKIVMRFSDELIRAAVGSAEFSDSRATDAMVRVLAERRDRVGRHWFAQVNPLDEFEIERSTTDNDSAPWLRFADLAVRHGFAPPRRYRVTVQTPDSEVRVFDTAETGVPLAAHMEALEAADSDDVEARLLRVTLRSQRGDDWSPEVRVTVYLRPTGGLRIVAVERRT